MGVGLIQGARLTLLAAAVSGYVFAMPTLRLTDSTVGPVSIAVGANGPQQKVEAFNAGDGQLSLTVSTSEDWIGAAVGAQTACTARPGNCRPITITLNTATLPKGTATGVVTVADPGAADAPQTITVTVLMGGGVPDAATFYVAPNGSTDEVAFVTTDELQFNVTTQTGGAWLSLTLDGSGSFRFEYPYRLQARSRAGLGEGVYNGSLNVTGSRFGPDIKSVPVTMRVTSEPIATLAPAAVRLRGAVGTMPLQSSVSVLNRGVGTLAVTGAEIVTGDGGDWITAETLTDFNVIVLRASLEKLAAGVFEATLTIESNAVNGPLTVPVVLEVVEQRGPLAGYQGTINNNTWDTPIAQGGIGSIFGEHLSYVEPAQGNAFPLVTELGGAKVFINGVEAPLFYSSYGQVNFQMPFSIQPGQALLQLTRDGVQGNVITVQVAERAARLLRIGIGEYGIIVNQDGTFPMPQTPGIPSRPARRGEALVIYAIGLGPTSPAVASGAAAPGAEPLARVVPTPTVFFSGGLTGGIAAAPFYVGMTPGSVGLYQINVLVPGNAPSGSKIPLRLEGPGLLSNTVEIAIE